ncbi:Gamma carbonic anhydrase 2, mitochondrial [Gracilariopsis chorda]|uniref:Gamma carbonic anhydrase 2, mitochondrial n=1 Tax=Gracilariopsis chorda TaxID=448386 RepID=A0A2V3IH11_9FLOR|nr:Gamma carbonic anhydrase 2, mitochondrial [Gracilariopsis chorda]|eukprot:PXF41342.1 Gamma carbonic anhydrase 2, mitochondrial [Gracilariopsis chorda]
MRRALVRRAAQHFRSLCSKPAPPGEGPNHRAIMSLDADTIRPYVQPNAFVAPSASVIGSVVINDKSAIMYGAVIRGDLALIQIGALTVIGENSVLTAGAVDGMMTPSDAVSTGLALEPELWVGDYCLIGAGVTLKGCHLMGDNIVGHCSSVAEGATLGRYAILEPGTSVGEGVSIPEGEVWGGSPAQKVRDVTDDEKLQMRQGAERRYSTTASHAYEFLPVGFGYLEKEALEKTDAAVASK